MYLSQKRNLKQFLLFFFSHLLLQIVLIPVLFRSNFSGQGSPVTYKVKNFLLLFWDSNSGLANELVLVNQYAKGRSRIL